MLKSGNARLRTVPDRGGLEVGRRRRGGQGEVPPAGGLDRQRQEGHRGDGPSAGDPAVADEHAGAALQGRRLRAARGEARAEMHGRAGGP